MAKLKKGDRIKWARVRNPHLKCERGTITKVDRYGIAFIRWADGEVTEAVLDDLARA